MYKIGQYLKMIENKAKVHSGYIDFDLFLKMSVAYHEHNENEELTKADIVMKYIKCQEEDYNTHSFDELKHYLENFIGNIAFTKDEQLEKQIAKILDDIFEDIASWQDYGFEPVHMTLADIYSDEIENQLILLDEHFYYKLYKHAEQRDLYLYHTGNETKILYTDEHITTIKQFLENLCHIGDK